MRNTNDPYGGTNTLVDKLIGNAYQTVRLVALNLKEICYVAFNMESIVKVSNQIAGNVTVKSVVGVPGSMLSVNLPEGVTFSMVQAVTASLVTTDSTMLPPGENSFTWTFEDGALRASISSTAPATVEGGNVLWFISYNDQTGE